MVPWSQCPAFLGICIYWTSLLRLLTQPFSYTKKDKNKILSIVGSINSPLSLAMILTFRVLSASVCCVKIWMNPVSAGHHIKLLRAFIRLRRVYLYRVLNGSLLAFFEIFLPGDQGTGGYSKNSSALHPSLHVRCKQESLLGFQRLPTKKGVRS